MSGYRTYGDRTHSCPAREFPQYVGRKLEAVVREQPEDRIVSIGSGSGYFFIGTREEFRKYGAAVLSEVGIGRERKIVDSYERINPADGIIIIVNGSEVGRFWLRSEFTAYLEEKKKKPSGRKPTVSGRRKRVGRMPIASVGKSSRQEVKA